MMIPSNYSINIARSVPQGAVTRNVHIARVELGDCISEKSARELFDDFCHRFPASEGFALMLDYTSCSGETIGYSLGA